MPIDELATPKDYTLILYNKTEIDTQHIAEALRVDTAMGLKSDKTDEGSPSGIATLDPSGKVSLIELPISTEIEVEDNTNTSTLVSPQRLHYLLDAQYDTSIESDAKFGNLESDGSVLMEAGYNPQNAKDIATVEYVQSIASGSNQTYVVATVVDMLAIAGIVAGDTCYVTDDVASLQADNGTYIALINNALLIADWSKQSNIVAWGSLIGTLSDQTDLQGALDLKADLTVADALSVRTTAVEAKTDFITVTQAVDLDIIESDTAINTAKISYSDAALVATHTTDIATNTTNVGTNTTSITNNLALFNTYLAKQTYDYNSVTNFTVANDLYENVNQLITLERGAGIYEVKLSMIYSLNSTTTSAFFRFSLDGGTTWTEIRKEPKDNTDQVTSSYVFPATHPIAAVKNIVIQARKEVASDILLISSIDISYEFKKDL